MVHGGLGPQSPGGAAAVAGDRADATRPRGLDRWGRFVVRRRWWVIAAWLLLAVVLAVPASSLHDVYRDVFTMSGANSQESTNLF